MAERAEAPAPAPLPSLEEALTWKGFKLDGIGGNAGRIEGVFVDADGGSPVWLVVRTRRFRQRTAVPFELAAAAADRVWVPYRRETIRSAPGIDPAAGMTPACERGLGAHFGIPPAALRMVALAGKDPERSSALLAST